MLVDVKDILSIIIATSAALLGPALTILALVPLIVQVISDKIRSHFAAAKERRRLTIALALLSGLSLALLLNIFILALSALWPTTQPVVIIVCGGVLLVSTLAFIISFFIGISIIWRVSDL